jgi:hypothetical protein
VLSSLLVRPDYASDEIADVTSVLESGGERAEGGGRRTDGRRRMTDDGRVMGEKADFGFLGIAGVSGDF